MQTKINKISLKKIVNNFSLSILSLIIGLVIMEIGLRFFFPVYTDVLFYGDEFIGYKHIPNKSGQYYFYETGKTKIKINSEGFRDIEHKIANPGGKYRIVFLGDSFADALQADFEKTFHQLLAKELEKEYPEKYEEFNFGIGAFSTGQEYLAYKYYVEKYKPDLVVLMFFTNDPLDNCCDDPYKPCFYIENETVREKSFKKKTYTPVKFFIAEYFKTSVFLRDELSKLKRVKAKKNDVESDGIFDSDKIFLKEYDSDIKKCWDISRHYLRELKKETSRADTGLKVFIIPHPASVYEKDKKRILDEDTLFNESYFDFNKPYNEIEKILKEENISYLNLMDTLKSKNERLYYFRDGHLNDKGHEVVFNAILKELEKDKINILL